MEEKYPEHTTPEPGVVFNPYYQLYVSISLLRIYMSSTLFCFNHARTFDFPRVQRGREGNILYTWILNAQVKILSYS